MDQMNNIIKKDILSVLKNSLTLINSHEYDKLKEVSNHTIHDASIYQDKDSITIAVVIYALSKIGERHGLKTVQKSVVTELQKCQKFLENNNIFEYRKCIKSIIRIISRVDKRIAMYVDEVTEKAQVKKGSKLHEHGVSIAKAASILGISTWELMSYVGKTRMHYAPETRDSVSKRLAFTRKIFKIGD